MRRKGFKYFASAALLATNILLTSCAAKTEEPASLETEVEIDEKSSSRSAANNLIANSIESSVDTAMEFVQNMDEFLEERTKFEETVNNSELIYTDEFKSVDYIYIEWNTASKVYEITLEKGEAKFELSLETSELINFIIHQTSCRELIINHDKDARLLSSLTTCDTIKEIGINHSDISTLEGLSNLTSLEKLSINNCPNITDLSPLSNLTNLTWIGINGTKVTDISPLANLSNLREANLRCNEITNPEVLSDLEYLSTLSIEFNAIENIDQLSAFVEKGIFSSEHAEGIIQSCETQRLSFAIDNFSEEGTVLMITYLDSKQSYFIEIRNDNTEIVKYALTDDTFDFYTLTKDLPNCTGIKLTNLPENFDHLSLANEEIFDAMVIDHCDIENLYFVDNFDNLTYLSIENCPNLAYDAIDFTFPPRYMRKLKTLIVKGTNMSDFSAIKYFPSLEGIELKNNNITDYGFLMHIPDLKVAIIGIDNYPVDSRPLETIQENGVTVKVDGYYLPLPDEANTPSDEDKTLGLTPEN